MGQYSTFVVFAGVDSLQRVTRVAHDTGSNRQIALVRDDAHHAFCTFCRRDSATAPTSHRLSTLAADRVSAPQLTVTDVIVASGAVGSKKHSAFHHFFASASWSLDRLGRQSLIA